MTRLWEALLLLILLSGIGQAIVYVNPTSNNTVSCDSWDNACSLSAGVGVACQNNDSTVLAAAGLYRLSTNITINCPLALQSQNGSESTFLVFDPSAGIEWQGRDEESPWNVSMTGFSFANGSHPFPTLSLTGFFGYVILDDLGWSNYQGSSILDTETNSTISLALTRWSVESSQFSTSPVVSVEGIETVLIEDWRWQSVQLQTLTNITSSLISIRTSEGTQDILFPEYAQRSANVTIQDVELSNITVGSVMTLENVNVYCQNVTMRNNSLVHGVRALSSALQMEACTFENQAVQSSALHLLNTTYRISSTQVNDNTVTNLGSVIIADESDGMLSVILDSNYGSYNGSIQQLKGNMIIMDSWFKNNSAEFGGAIYQDGGTLSIFTSNFTLSSAESYGGVIYQNEGSLNVSASKFTSNIAISYGGVIFQNEGISNISQSTFAYNIADVYGGAIFQSGGASTISTTNFTRNYARSNGGAIYLYQGSLDLSSSQFNGNYGDNGGAFYQFMGALTVFTSNFADHIGLSDGGVLYQYRGKSSVSTSTFTNNQAQLDGAVIYLFKGTSDIAGSNFIENHAYLHGGVMFEYEATSRISQSMFASNIAESDGGVIYQFEGSSSIASSNFTANVAISGGAFYQRAGSSNLITSSFAHNIATEQGGDISISNTTQVTVANSTFFASSSLIGGSIFLKDVKFEITSSTWNATHSYYGGGMAISSTSGSISQSMFVGSTGEFGGALDIEQSSVSVDNSSFVDCFALLGGGGFVRENSTILLSNDSVFQGCNAQIRGGAMMLDNSEATLSATVVRDNYSPVGGAFYILHNASLTATDSYLEGNYANYVGGAFYLTDQAILRVEASVIRNSTASDYGGCIYMDGDASVLLNQTQLVGNVATGGAAVQMTGRSQLTLLESSCVNNTAQKTGGCVNLLSSSSMQSFNSTISNNKADLGGGFYINGPGGVVEDVDSSFYANVASQGGGMYVGDHQTVTISDCVFKSNVANETGGALMLSEQQNVESSLLFSNVTFYDNQASLGGGIYVSFYVNHTVQFEQCCLNSNTASQFGAAVYLDSRATLGLPLMINSSFADNFAEYGGCILGTSGLSAVSSQELEGSWCSSCSLGTPPSSYSGYQSAEQSATEPTTLNSNSTDVYLDQRDATLSLYLSDRFGTIVEGTFLRDHPYQVQTSWTPGITSNATSWNLTDSVPVVHPVITDSGASQTTQKIAFNATSTVGFTYNNLLAVTMNKCSKSYFIPVFGVCRSEILLAFIISATTLLVFILTVLGCVGCFRAGRRLIREYKLRSMQVPDLSRGGYTLEDLLQDDNIASLEWSEIEFGAILGKGASGLVRRATWHKKGAKPQEIATKELLLMEELMSDSGAVEEFCKEIKYMSSLYHPNVVAVVGIIVSPDQSNIYLASELMERGSLHDLILKKGENIPLAIRFQIAIDTAEGMNFIHSKGVIHRDLKSHNLLINEQWQTKVADFGISTINPTVTRKMTCIGTPVYMAPEVLLQDKYSARADVFSYGIVLSELFTNRSPYSHPPYDTMNTAQLTHHILELNARPSIEDLHPTLQGLIDECWSRDPHVRPPFSEIIGRMKRLRRDLSLNVNRLPDLLDSELEDIQVVKETDIEASSRSSTIQ